MTVLNFVVRIRTPCTGQCQREQDKKKKTADEPAHRLRLLCVSDVYRDVWAACGFGPYGAVSPVCAVALSAITVCIAEER